MTVFAGLASTVAQKTLSYFFGDDGGATKASQRGTSGLNLGDTWEGIEDDFMFNLVPGPGKPSWVNNAIWEGLKKDESIGLDFFEDYHVIPRLFAFGNILSDQSSALSVFSAYRRDTGSWTDFTNNAGAGTSLSGEPSLPAVMYPLSGYAMTLEVSTNGTPTVNSTLDFEFDSGTSEVEVPIMINRIVLFPIRPEIPYIEKLQFLTDIIEHEDGGEMRISDRKNPRQFFEWDVRMDDGTFENSRFDTLMFDWQSRTWGVPMWHEATDVTVAATAGDFVINVASTDYADYRVGGLVMIFTDSSTFDVQTVASFTSTTITVEDAIINSYAVDTTVAPMRTGVVDKTVGTSRWTSGDQTAKLRFRILDNDSNLEDTSAFGTYNSKVLLETCNVMRSTTKSATLVRDIIVVDNQTGVTFQDSPWDNGKSAYPLTLRAGSSSELWDIRGLLHALRGRQVSFYLPTFRQDLVPNQALVSSSLDLNITNIGYVQFVHERQPKDRIWLRTTDGTTYTRQIASSLVVDSTTETLTMDSTWGANIALADIDRISYLEEVRFDTDEVEIRYVLGEGRVYVSAPVRTLFD